MVYTYTPSYYSSIHDTIASLCKSILPFSSKNRRIAGNRHSDNLKWQQESFHRILNLVGLHKEGIVPEAEVSTFRTHVLDTLVSSPAEPEPPGVIRDKLLFLQELFYAKCISAEQYHSSKRPLLQRLAVQGVEIDSRDVIVGCDSGEPAEEEWSVIDLRDKDEISPATKKSKHRASPMKGAMSLLGMVSWSKEKKESAENHEKGTVLMPESSGNVPRPERKKKFRGLFQKEQGEVDGTEVKLKRSNSKKQWGFEGLKKWKRSGRDSDESTAEHLLLENQADDGSEVSCQLVASPVGEGPDTKRIKKKIHNDGAASDFFIDKVLGENIKKELSRIQSELGTTNPNNGFSSDQIEAISTSLPVDKTDLKTFFPKSWCDRYGDVVLDVVKKEFKDHVSEMEIQKKAIRDERTSSENWVTFEEENDENFHPNLYSQNPSLLNKRTKNPFEDEFVQKGGNGFGSATKNPFQDTQKPLY